MTRDEFCFFFGSNSPADIDRLGTVMRIGERNCTEGRFSDEKIIYEDSGFFGPAFSFGACRGRKSCQLLGQAWGGNNLDERISLDMFLTGNEIAKSK